MATSALTKRRDPAGTKARILVAAAETFTTMGYSGAGLREIARRANVASSLLARHFGSKAALYEAALLETIRLNSVFTWEKRDFGKTMVELMRSESTMVITAMLMQGLSDPSSREIADRVWRDRIIAPLANWLGEPDALGRAQNLYALMAGFTLMAQNTDRTQSSPQALAWQGAALQSIVDNTPLNVTSSEAAVSPS